MNFPKREELLLRTVFALPKHHLQNLKKLAEPTESLQDGVGLDDLVLEGDLLGVGVDRVLLAEGLLLRSTDSGEVGNNLNVIIRLPSMIN